MALPLALALGLALLGVVTWDLSTYKYHPRTSLPSVFPIMERQGNLRTGNVELYTGLNTVLQMMGIGELERESGIRHALGPKTTLAISSTCKEARVYFCLINRVEGQRLSISFNGETLEVHEDLPVGKLERSFTLILRPNINRFDLDFARYNHFGADWAPQDTRTLAGTFTALAVVLKQS